MSFSPNWITRALPEPMSGLPAATSGVPPAAPNVPGGGVNPVKPAVGCAIRVGEVGVI